MSLTGHRTASVYQRYAIVEKADQVAGVAKLAKHAAPAPADAAATVTVTPIRDAAGR